MEAGHVSLLANPLAVALAMTMAMALALALAVVVGKVMWLR
jgi:hypothetical protein